MPTAIHNDAELQAIKLVVQQTALEYVANQAVDYLKELTSSLVYLGYTPMGDGNGTWIEHGGGAYGRSGQFMDAWDVLGTNQIMATVGYNTDLITLNPEAYMHGSPSSPITQEELADLIFSGYSVFNSGHGVPPRNVWEEFINMLPIKIRQWAVEGLSLSI